MQLRIPHAPRPVTLSQIPGARRRLLVVGALGFVGIVALGFVGQVVGAHVIAEQRFLARAVSVEGTVVAVALPPLETRDHAAAQLTALYDLRGARHSATAIAMNAFDAERLGKGAKVTLLVDPAEPDHPREQRAALRAAQRTSLLPFGFFLGVLLAVAAIIAEAARTVRSDLEPIRHGALVWLTPDQPLPADGRPTVISATYYRDDVKHPVRARFSPKRAPVRNGEKVLAAIVPARPTWARVVDEELAARLGWRG